jgi:hypothetical protein
MDLLCSPCKKSLLPAEVSSSFFRALTLALDAESCPDCAYIPCWWLLSSSGHAVLLQSSPVAPKCSQTEEEKHWLKWRSCSERSCHIFLCSLLLRAL